MIPKPYRGLLLLAAVPVVIALVQQWQKKQAARKSPGWFARTIQPILAGMAYRYVIRRLRRLVL